MRISKVLIVLPAILALSILTAAPAMAYRLNETWEGTYEVDEGALLELENVNGTISVEGWDRDEIHVVAEIRIKAPSKDRARKIFKRIEFDVESDRGMVAVRADLPKLKRGFFGFFGDDNESVRVSYIVRAPYATDIDLESVNGRIDVDEVGGVFRVKTVNGGIDLRMLGGEGDVRTVNGGIDCSLRDFPDGGELSAKTVNGSVEIELPEDLDAELDLKVTNGRISVDFDLDDIHTAKRRRVVGSIGRGSGSIHVRTLNGGISIEPF